MGEEPLDLDKHRGMAAQRATDLRRTLVEVENHARELRDRQTALENQLLSLRAETWLEAAAKARYVLNLYVASLPSEDTRHRNLVAAILDDFSRLSRNA
jgi:predicted  nucleic acid-binding Zn-ribbon protein